MENVDQQLEKYISSNDGIPDYNYSQRIRIMRCLRELDIRLSPEKQVKVWYGFSKSMNTDFFSPEMITEIDQFLPKSYKKQEKIQSSDGSLYSLTGLQKKWPDIFKFDKEDKQLVQKLIDQHVITPNGYKTWEKNNVTYPMFDFHNGLYVHAQIRVRNNYEAIDSVRFPNQATALLLENLKLLSEADGNPIPEELDHILNILKNKNEQISQGIDFRGETGDNFLVYADAQISAFLETAIKNSSLDALKPIIENHKSHFDSRRNGTSLSYQPGKVWKINGIVERIELKKSKNEKFKDSYVLHVAVNDESLNFFVPGNSKLANIIPSLKENDNINLSYEHTATKNKDGKILHVNNKIISLDGREQDNTDKAKSKPKKNKDDDEYISLQSGIDFIETFSRPVRFISAEVVHAEEEQKNFIGETLKLIFEEVVDSSKPKKAVVLQSDTSNQRVGGKIVRIVPPDLLGSASKLKHGDIIIAHLHTEKVNFQYLNDETFEASLQVLEKIDPHKTNIKKYSAIHVNKENEYIASIVSVDVSMDRLYTIKAMGLDKKPSIIRGDLKDSKPIMNGKIDVREFLRLARPGCYIRATGQGSHTWQHEYKMLKDSSIHVINHDLNKILPSGLQVNSQMPKTKDIDGLSR